MVWKNKQKSLVHKYARLAGLADPEYRAHLYEATGFRSAKHPGLGQWHFDVAMAEFERVLEYRIQEGFVPAPPLSAIRDLRYWRNRLTSPGMLNTRHAHEIRELWALLTPHLPESERTPEYLAGIASKACGLRIDDVWTMRAWQAGLLLSALRDRLHHATRSGETAAVA